MTVRIAYLLYFVAGLVIGYYRTRAWLRRLNAKYPLATPAVMHWLDILLYGVCWPLVLVAEAVTYEPFGIRKRKV